MYQFLNKNIKKTGHFILLTVVTFSLIILTFVFKNDQKVSGNIKVFPFQSSDIQPIKNFLLKQIKSPFTNINYKIKKGDTIQKILQKLEIRNNEIQAIINQFKKYNNSGKLQEGNQIDIVVEEKTSEKDNLIAKFSVPITSSTTIEIYKDDDNKITSKKIITKLFKKKVVAENIISKNLYSSAIEAKVNPDTIVEFARIFGFEIDFQRDIRKKRLFQNSL